MWMATFSDLVTLMMAFFVMLVAMANFDDTQRIEAVIESVQQALGTHGTDSRALGTSKKPDFTEAIRRAMSLQPTQVAMTQALAKHTSDDHVRMVQTEQELRIRLPARVFFEPNSAVLHPGAYALLADLAKVLVADDLKLRVEGYADQTGDELSNWKLSGDRALAVVLALREKGPVPGENLSAMAMGSFVPGAVIGEDAEWNRRVELVVTTSDKSGGAAGRLLNWEGPHGR
jgi:chemotaxis protein MotB